MWGFEKRDLKLILNFLKMNIRDKYLASNVGSILAIVNPLLMLSIYTFVFGFVYKSKLPGAETTLGYAIWMISGYGPWMAMSEGISVSTLSVASASGLVKNMAFKTEVLPISGALMGLVSLTVTLIFLAVLLIASGEGVTWHVVIIPLVIVVQSLFICAIGFFLSAINVFVRDVGYMLPNFLMILLFATPIFYSLDGLPEFFRLLSKMNPFYILTEGYRQPLISHQLPDFFSFGYVVILSLVLAYVGLKFFRRVKGQFEGRL